MPIRLAAITPRPPGSIGADQASQPEATCNATGLTPSPLSHKVVSADTRSEAPAGSQAALVAKPRLSLSLTWYLEKDVFDLFNYAENCELLNS